MFCNKEIAIIISSNSIKGFNEIMQMDYFSTNNMQASLA